VNAIAILAAGLIGAEILDVAKTCIKRVGLEYRYHSYVCMANMKLKPSVGFFPVCLVGRRKSNARAGKYFSP